MARCTVLRHLLSFICAALVTSCGADEIVGRERMACRALPSRAAARLLMHREPELSIDRDTLDRCAYSTTRGDLLAFDFFTGTSFDDQLPQLGWTDARNLEDVGERAVGRSMVVGDRFGLAQVLAEDELDLLVVTVRLWEPRDPLPIAVEATRSIFER